MKKLTLATTVGSLFAVAVMLLTPKASFADHRPHLDMLGRWYMGTNMGLPTELRSEGHALYVVNEKGQRSRLDLSEGRVYAIDWNLEGKVVANRTAILWANGTWWSRGNVLPGGHYSPNELEGTYRGGICQNANHYCEVQVREHGLLLVNEAGVRSRAFLNAQGRLVAHQWNNLQASVLGGFHGQVRLLWDNGTWWSR